MFSSLHWQKYDFSINADISKSSRESIFQFLYGNTGKPLHKNSPAPRPTHRRCIARAKQDSTTPDDRVLSYLSYGGCEREWQVHG